ncbi:hypothetical protein AAMO2058_001316600 [Amorphochlora amoebiformis]
MASRVGSADASEPGLAAHWAITGVCIAIFVGLSIWTQGTLVMLRKQSYVVQMVDHPHIVTALLICLLVWSIPPLIEGAANADMPCSVYIVITQIAASGLVGIIAFKTLRFTHRVAVVQGSKLFVCQHKARNIPKGHIRSIRRIKRALKENRPRDISLSYFILGLLIAVIDTNSRKQLADESDICTMRSSAMIFISWLLFVCPYLIFLRSITFTDPFYIVWKLKVLTLVGIILIIPFSMGAILVEPKIGTSHFNLLGHKYLWVLQMVTWYLYSYLPMKLTLKKVEEANDVAGGPSLLDTLTNPALLEKFENHLIQEWSHENVLFFKEVTLQQLEARKCHERVLALFAPKKKNHFRSLSGTLISGSPNGSARQTLSSPDDKAKREVEHLRTLSLRIYYRYVRIEAAEAVNIPSKIRAKLITFFEDPVFDMNRDLFMDNQSNASSLATIPTNSFPPTSPPKVQIDRINTKNGNNTTKPNYYPAETQGERESKYGQSDRDSYYERNTESERHVQEKNLGSHISPSNFDSHLNASGNAVKSGNSNLSISTARGLSSVKSSDSASGPGITMGSIRSHRSVRRNDVDSRHQKRRLREIRAFCNALGHHNPSQNTITIIPATPKFRRNQTRGFQIPTGPPPVAEEKTKEGRELAGKSTSVSSKEGNPGMEVALGGLDTEYDPEKGLEKGSGKTDVESVHQVHTENKANRNDQHSTHGKNDSASGLLPMKIPVNEKKVDEKHVDEKQVDSSKQALEDILNLLKVFELAKQAVFNLMERDTHRRFRRHLRAEHKNATQTRFRAQSRQSRY